MVEQEFGQGHVMASIAYHESHYEPGAWNCVSSASGIFQIIRGTWEHFDCQGNVFNARDNIACARKIYDANGTRDWDASKHLWGKEA